jgi:ketosteroid isomerase-like protein
MNVDAGQAAVKETITKWLEATNQVGDAGADGYAAFVTEDAVMLPPNARRIDGRAGVREMALGFTSAEDFSISWKANRIDVAADGKRALAIGEFEYSMKDAAGRFVSDKGKFLDAFEKQADGTWLCSVASWNSDLPADSGARQAV